MLKKLLKYDLIYMYKCLIIFYVLSIVCAICTRIFGNVGDALIFVIIAKIFNGATITMMINILINNVLRMWARFSSNLYGDESYLTHTLPVNKSTLYASKFLTLVATVVTSGLIIILTLLIAYVDSFDQLKTIIDNYVFTDAKVIDVILLIIIMLIQFIHMVQLGYTGIILGNRHINLRLIKSMVYGFIGYIITQLVMVIYIAILSMSKENVRNVLFTTKGINMPNTALEDVLKILVYGLGMVYIVITVVLYVVNRKLLNKGVNVD